MEKKGFSRFFVNTTASPRARWTVRAASAEAKARGPPRLDAMHRPARSLLLLSCGMGSFARRVCWAAPASRVQLPGLLRPLFASGASLGAFRTRCTEPSALAASDDALRPASASASASESSRAGPTAAAQAAAAAPILSVNPHLDASLPYRTLAFYIISRVPEPAVAVEAHRAFLARRGMVGRVYICADGINAQVRHRYGYGRCPLCSREGSTAQHGLHKLCGGVAQWQWKFGAVLVSAAAASAPTGSTRRSASPPLPPKAHRRPTEGPPKPPPPNDKCQRRKAGTHTTHAGARVFHRHSSPVPPPPCFARSLAKTRTAPSHRHPVANSLAETPTAHAYHRHTTAIRRRTTDALPPPLFTRYLAKTPTAPPTDRSATD